jgi:4-carboxymuconolactone decarboxylase
MERLKPLKMEEMNDEQLTIIANRPHARIDGPYTVWLRRPTLAKVAVPVLRHLRRGDIVVPRRLAELAILTVARGFTAQFAWSAHEPQAVTAGLDQKIIDDIRHRRTPTFTDDEEALTFAIASELTYERKISDATFARARAKWSEEMLVDLVSLIGFYAMIGTTLSAFQVDPLPGGRPLE